MGMIEGFILADLTKSKNDGKDAGEGGAILIMLIFGIALMLIALAWLYPITLIVSIFLWHLTTYAFTWGSAVVLKQIEWCINYSFFGLLPAIFGHSNCDHGVTSSLVGYNLWAALFAFLTILVVSAFIIKPIEKQLIKIQGYYTVRHIWRCCFPAALFLYWSTTRSEMPFSNVGTLLIPIALAAATHFTLRHSKVRLTTPPIPAPAVRTT